MRRVCGLRPSAWLVALGLGLSGCAHEFPERYGPDALRADAQRWPGEALVHYLSRPGARATVCERDTFPRVDSSLVGPFVESLGRPDVPPKRWGACAGRLLRWLPGPRREELLEGVARQVPGLVEQRDPARLRVVTDVLEGRLREPSPALAHLRERLQPIQVPPGEARAALDSLRGLLELEEGRLNGEPLTEAGALALDDEGLLRRIEARAPAEAIRTAARRKVVRLHIGRSTVREVKARADEVEAAVLATGRWAQRVASLAPPVPQPALVAPVDVRLAQELATQVVHPFIARGDARHPADVDLRPLLRFHVGWSEPLALCDEPAALAVEPCVDPSEVQLGTGFATLDARGVLHLLPTWAMADAVELTRAGVGLVVPLRLGERLSQVVQVPLTAQAPASFCFEGGPTERGPLVNVVVVAVAQGLLVDAADERGRRVRFVLPRLALGFEFGSCGGRGLPGTPGAKGADGASGSTGMSASCPSMPGGSGGQGGNGQPGGAGGAGGPGGAGGAMRVELVCEAPCEAGDDALLRAIFRSRGGLGGDGGPGGAGGRGGSGGSGGSGTSCYQNGKTTYLSGGSQGSSGSPGASGATGPRGAPGEDGPVQFLRR